MMGRVYRNMHSWLRRHEDYLALCCTYASLLGHIIVSISKYYGDWFLCQDHFSSCWQFRIFAWCSSFVFQMLCSPPSPSNQLPQEEVWEDQQHPPKEEVKVDLQIYHWDTVPFVSLSVIGPNKVAIARYLLVSCLDSIVSASGVK